MRLAIKAGKCRLRSTNQARGLQRPVRPAGSASSPWRRTRSSKRSSRPTAPGTFASSCSRERRPARPSGASGAMWTWITVCSPAGHEARNPAPPPALRHAAGARGAAASHPSRAPRGAGAPLRALAEHPQGPAGRLQPRACEDRRRQPQRPAPHVRELAEEPGPGHRASSPG